MAMVDYPQELPTDAALVLWQDLTRMDRSAIDAGTYHAAWNLMGFALKEWQGNPIPVIGDSGPDQLDPCDEHCLAAIGRLAGVIQEEPQAVVSAIPIPWNLIIQYLLKKFFDNIL